MKCLSVRQPWAWAILHAGKDIENRTWAPSPKQLKPGERLAIHASKSFDVDGLRWIVEHHEELGIGLADIPIDPKAYPVGCVVGSVEFVGTVNSPLRYGCNTSRWFFGPVGWLVQNPVVLAEPAPMKGRLMLWEIGDLPQETQKRRGEMSKKKNAEQAGEASAGRVEAAGGEAAEKVYSRFTDIRVETKQVPVRLSDARLLEIADEACEKHRAVDRLNAEIKAFKDARKDHIKSLTQEAADLDEQFYKKTVNEPHECRVMKDFEAGKVRIEIIESGELVEERDMLPDEFQREFESVLEADPSDMILQRAVDAIRRLSPTTDPVELPAAVSEALVVSVAFGERIVLLLRDKKVLGGDGSDESPLFIDDPTQNCDSCRHFTEGENQPTECEECESGCSNWKPHENCGLCVYGRQLKVFAPCAKCNPADKNPSGFKALVD